MAWTMAGWETVEVDIEAEALVLRRRKPHDHRNMSLEELWPVYESGAWPKRLSLRRKEIYP